MYQALAVLSSSLSPFLSPLQAVEAHLRYSLSLSFFVWVLGPLGSWISLSFLISLEGLGVKMAGKGGKGLLAAKTTAAGKDKDKKKPVSRSSRAGLQVLSPSSLICLDSTLVYVFFSF